MEQRQNRVCVWNSYTEPISLYFGSTYIREPRLEVKYVFHLDLGILRIGTQEQRHLHHEPVVRTSVLFAAFFQVVLAARQTKRQLLVHLKTHWERYLLVYKP